MKLNLPEVSASKNWIPVDFTNQGRNISPRLEWSGVPQKTKEFALICEDLDTRNAQPFVHWLIYGLSDNTSIIPKGINNSEKIDYPAFARQGKNSAHGIGYTGPNLAFYQKAHRYAFRLFALDKPLPLKPGATRAEFYQELNGKIIEEAKFVGIYQKSRKKFWNLMATGSIAIIVVGLGARTRLASLK